MADTYEQGDVLVDGLGKPWHVDLPYTAGEDGLVAWPADGTGGPHSLGSLDKPVTLVVRHGEPLGGKVLVDL